MIFFVLFIDYDKNAVDCILIKCIYIDSNNCSTFERDSLWHVLHFVCVCLGFLFIGFLLPKFQVLPGFVFLFVCIYIAFYFKLYISKKLVDFFVIQNSNNRMLIGNWVLSNVSIWCIRKATVHFYNNYLVFFFWFVIFILCTTITVWTYLLGPCAPTYQKYVVVVVVVVFISLLVSNHKLDLSSISGSTSFDFRLQLHCYRRSLLCTAEHL